MRVAVFLVPLLLFMAGCSEDGGGPDDADDGPDGTPSPAPSGPGGQSPPPPDDPAGNASLTPVTIEVALSGAYPVNIAYDPARIEVAAGSLVTLVFTNNDVNPLPSHDWVLEGVEGAATDTIGNGQTTEVTFEAPPPGEYAFFCSVGDHRDQGMEGVFVVT